MQKSQNKTAFRVGLCFIFVLGIVFCIFFANSISIKAAGDFTFPSSYNKLRNVMSPLGSLNVKALEGGSHYSLPYNERITVNLPGWAQSDIEANGNRNFYIEHKGSTKTYTGAYIQYNKWFKLNDKEYDVRINVKSTTNGGTFNTGWISVRGRHLGPEYPIRMNLTFQILDSETKTPLDLSKCNPIVYFGDVDGEGPNSNQYSPDEAWAYSTGSPWSEAVSIGTNMLFDKQHVYSTSNDYSVSTNELLYGNNYVYSDFNDVVSNPRIDFKHNVYYRVPPSQINSDGSFDYTYWSNAWGYTTSIDVRFEALQVEYKATNGSVTGITSENVPKDLNPTGTTTKPNTGYELKHWTCDKTVTLKNGTSIAAGQPISNANVKNIVLKSDITLTAVHTKKQYQVTTSVTNGTITPTATVEYGSNKTITYVPTTGYELQSVTVNGSSVNIATYPTSYTFSNITANQDIKVVYKIKQFDVTTSVTNGTITPSSKANYGTNKTITYTPNEGYELQSITVNGTAVNINTYPNSYTFSNITANQNIKVVYKIKQFDIITNVIDGTITPSERVNWGTNKTVMYSPNPGYSLQSVSIDGQTKHLDDYRNKVDFTNIKANHRVDIIYGINRYDVVTTAINGTITQGRTVDFGSSFTAEYKPFEGYEIESITVNGQFIPINGNEVKYTLTDIKQHSNVRVVFKKKNYKITTSVVNGSIDDGVMVEHGNSSTISYSPNKGYKLSSITVDGNDVSDLTAYQNSYAFKNIDQNHDIAVKYEKIRCTVTTNAINGTISEGGTLDYGEKFTITYQPNKGYKLDSIKINHTWAMSSQNPISYTFDPIDGDKNVTVTFIKQDYVIKTKVINGTIDEDRFTEYERNEIIKYAPNEGYELKSITVDGKKIDNVNDYLNSYEFKAIENNHDITVEFAKKKYDVITKVTGGKISDRVTVEHGDNYEVAYQPDTGFELKDIKVNGESINLEQNADKYMFSNITANQEIEVIYAKKVYNVTTSVIGGNIRESFRTEYGSNESIDYIPNEGYELSKIIVDGVPIDNIKDYPNAYTFSNITNNHTIDVEFMKKKFNIVTEVVGGTITDSQVVEYGNDVLIEYHPNDGYRLLSVTVDGESIDASSECEFKEVKDHHTIKVVYEKIPELKAEKLSNKEFYKKGDIAEYTIKVSQTFENADARNVIIADELPDGMVLDKDSLIVTGLDLKTEWAEKTDNKFVLKVEKLDGVNDVVITYKAQIVSDDIKFTNKVNVTADNLTADSELPKYIYTEKIINIVKPIIEKTVDKSEVKLGDEVTYIIMAKQTNEEALMNNVVITDVIPEGFDFKDVVCENQDAKIEYNPDNRTLTVALTQFKGDLSVAVIGSANIKSGTINNVVTMISDEIPEGISSNVPITVVSPVIKVQKEGDKKEVFVGDIVNYKVIVTGQNVVNGIFIDKLPEGLKYVENSLKVNCDEIGVVPVVNVAGNIMRVDVSSLNSDLTIEYQAEVVTDGEIKNIAMFVCKNGDEPCADEFIITASEKIPEFIIEKKASTEKIMVDEVVQYEVSVTGTNVENGVLIDTLPDNLELNTESVKCDDNTTTTEIQDNVIMVKVPELNDKMVVTYDAKSVFTGEAKNIATFDCDRNPVENNVAESITDVVDEQQEIVSEEPKPEEEPEKDETDVKTGVDGVSLIAVVILVIALTIAGSILFLLTQNKSELDDE